MSTNDAPMLVQRMHTHARKPEDHDRFFTTNRAMITIKGKALVEAIAKSLKEREAKIGGRQRKRRPIPQLAFDRAVEAIVCDLIHAELTDHPKRIAVPRSKEILCKASRYKPWFYSRQFTDALDLLMNADFITQDKGKWKPNKQGQRTLIKSAHRLLELIADVGLTLFDIGRTSDGETIQLKNHEKERHEYEDTEKTYRLRQQMEELNEWIGKAGITFDQSCKDDGAFVDVGKKRLYRVFIRGSFAEHGRMYGGFWIPLRKSERLAGLRIDGQRVVGLDYGQAFPRIAYGLAGHDPPTGDLYLIPGLEEWRLGIKKLMNSMFNYDKIFAKKPKGLKKLLPEEIDVYQLQTAIRRYHQPIASMLGTNSGQELTLIESEVMVSVLLMLKQRGVVALPIHDCIIVKKDHQELAKKVMMDAFYDLVGVSAVVAPECDVTEDNSEDEHHAWSQDLTGAYA